MGNKCYNPDNYDNYHQPEGDEPSSVYAIQMVDPKDLPCDLGSIHSQYGHETLDQPSWYEPYNSLKIDAFFYIKRYELYYRGQWKKGIPHGFGQVVTSNGSYYKGFFKEGVAQGPKCLFILNQNTHYLGAVQNNQRHGYGKFKDEGYQYQGQWSMNHPNGKGEEVYPNGDSFSGNFENGLKHGQGLYQWKSGVFQKYKGSFVENEIQGQGQLLCRDGRIWKGIFNLDKDFTITNAECQQAQKVFRGNLLNGRPENSFVIDKRQDPQELFHDERYELRINLNKFSGKSLSDKESFMILEDKMLVYYDREVMSQDLMTLLNLVEESYQQVQRHSQALEKVKSKLPRFECAFWKEGEAIDGIAIIPICGKYIKISPLQHRQ